MRTFRVLLIGAGLTLVGALMGAIAGMSAAAIVVTVMDGFDGIGGPLLFVSAVFGAALGMVLAPLSAFTFLRHVPLWRLFAEVTAGTIVAGVLTALVNFNPTLVLCAGVLGFLAAGARLAHQFDPARAPKIAPPNRVTAADAGPE